MRRCKPWGLVVLGAVVGIVGAASPSAAEDEPPASEADAGEQAEQKAIDLTIDWPDHPKTTLLPSLRVDTVWFTGNNAWAGNAAPNIGKGSDGWAEFGVVPALDADISLEEWGSLHARVSAVYTTTRFGLDWGGSNFRDGHVKTPQEITLEDAYVRWNSGDVFPALGKDAVQISVGSQPYEVGFGTSEGFLFYNGGSDGGKRGGYWLGLRNAFEFATIARVQTEEFLGETVYLRSNDLGGRHTETVGANFEYDFAKMLDIEKLRFGVGYWNVVDSDDSRRDGLNVVDFRFDALPLSVAPGWGLAGEFTKENNGHKNDSYAVWAETGYDLGKHDVAWAPYASYRFIYFSGDDLSTRDDNRFDPLYYGFADWNQWYIGEIAGEWVTANSNFQAQLIRFRVNPIESVTLQLYYIYLRLNERQNQLAAPGGRPIDPRVAAIDDKDLSHEVDFIADWAANDYLSFSFVAALLKPQSGAKDFFGDDKVWTQFMLYTSLQF